MLLSRLTCSLLLYFSVLCSTLASGYCGDGICETPELADSCPTDCGEVVRNPRLFGQAPTPPYFWALDPPDASVTYLNHTGPETEQKSLAVQLPGSAAVTQTLALIPGHHYSLRMVTDPPASECWRGFVYTSAEVLADTVGHNEFIAPESGATGGVFVGARATPTCQSAAGLSSISVISLPNNANFGFHYPAVYETFLGDPHRGVSPKESVPPQNRLLIAGQVCPGTEEEGCGGCYLLGRRPSDGAVERKEGWYAGVERLVPAVRGGDGDGMDAEACRAWLLEQSAHDEDFYNEKSGKLYKYHDCGMLLRTDRIQVPKQVFVGGAHYPTIVVANHRTPEPKMPSEKHDPTAILPHFFALPFYDTNIGNMIKNTGCMNVLQSYEMQSILKPGDVFIDAGANLGSYTIPIAEHLGPAGMVLAFEPFRWTYQLLNANAALSDTAGQSLLLQPQLRFFSSPGGVRANPTNQTGGLSEEDSKQLYDTEWGAEAVEAVRLDDIIFDSNLFAGRNREPTVSLIKIDVEGMEVNVMRGALRTLETFHPIVWSENVDYFEKEDLSFIALMDSLDYTCAKASAAPTDLVCQDKYGRGPTPIALTEA
ncbi:hypothetical protein FOL47_010618 [Perkinsus chesapeaki]|uniref:Methyltransferase FkbM domain-containing protein n=1 Tax=Perkinsus chesapeaki TaxID=330153 RepID=A0A7J6L312_PERCH|nr:hypothetical protein FOL47_010618 [Perkinsus chesapeaki]